MQMTEEEARKVACPEEDRQLDFGDGTGIPKATVNERNCCTASGCALWEWVDNAAKGKARRGECGMKRKTVIIMQQPQQPGPKIPMLRNN